MDKRNRLLRKARPVLAGTLALLALPSLDAADIVCRGQWSLAATSGPPGRNRHAMAYDELRQKVVLFGGFQDNSYTRLGDTWEWDGAQWAQKASTGPSPRTHTAMAYDSARNLIVLFGGVGKPNKIYADNKDTWTWDGSTWKELGRHGPAARNAHGMAYDIARRRVVMYGGGVTFGSLFSDTWEWDGKRWIERAPAHNPGPRAPVSSIAYDHERGRVSFFGDSASCGGPFDTWEWDGTDWAQVSTTAPSTKVAPAMAYDSARHRLVLFAGDLCNGDKGGQTWEWDGTAWLKVATSGPGPRGAAPAMAFDREHGQVVFFGGASPVEPDMGDTWTWSGPIYRCGTPMPGDLNCDGVVDRDDLQVVRTARGARACAADDPRDLDGDGHIDWQDAKALIGLCTRTGCGTH